MARTSKMDGNTVREEIGEREIQDVIKAREEKMIFPVNSNDR
jgi:hypothetical protein